jgi:hypothetical protein
MTWQQIFLIVGSLMLCIGTVSLDWQRCSLAILFFAANIITFIFMVGGK